MPSKLQFYMRMADHTAKQITGSFGEWTAFLETMARLQGDEFAGAVLCSALAQYLRSVCAASNSSSPGEVAKYHVCPLSVTRYAAQVAAASSCVPIVRGHRVPYLPEQGAAAAEEKPAASSWTQHYLTGLGIGLGAVVVAGGAYFLVRRCRHA